MVVIVGELTKQALCSMGFDDRTVHGVAVSLTVACCLFFRP